MIDPGSLYFLSDTYRELLDKIGNEISLENKEQRSGNSVKASKHGWNVWEALLELLDMLKANSVYELDVRGVTTYDLLYWAGSFADELHNACREEKSLISKKFVFLKTYVEMHEGLLEEEVRNLGNIRVHFAESYYEQGQIEVADALFQKWLDADPQWIAGWTSWADCYWLWKSLGIETNYEKAEKLYQQALFLSESEDKKFILDRLKGLNLEKNPSELISII